MCEVPRVSQGMAQSQRRFCLCSPDMWHSKAVWDVGESVAEMNSEISAGRRAGETRTKWKVACLTEASTAGIQEEGCAQGKPLRGDFLARPCPSPPPLPDPEHFPEVLRLYLGTSTSFVNEMMERTNKANRPQRDICTEPRARAVK